MKKFTAILLTVIMVASLFTSCSNSIAPNIDETVSVSFDEATSRSLTASLENFVKGDYFWKYAARKADTTGLTSGATSSYDEAGAQWVKGDATSEDNKGLGSVAGFSQGKWDFQLFAYKAVPSGTGESATTTYKLVYQGELTGVSLKKGSDNSVKVSVSPVAGEEGTLVMNENGITFKPKKVGDATTGFTKFYTVTALGSTSSIDSDEGKTNEWTLDAGAYKVNVDFVKDGYVYATGSVVATVYSNLTTTVSGQLDELLTEAIFDSSINPDIMNKVASSSDVVYSTLTAENAQPVTLTTEGDSKIQATVPAAAAATVISNTVGSDKVTATDKVRLYVSVDTTAATSSSLSLEISMNAVVTKTADNGVEEISVPVENLGENIAVVEVSLQPGLNGVCVAHNSVAMSPLTTVDQAAEGFFYDSGSGILTIKVKSFSPFSVTYDAPEYVAKIGDTKYTSLESAFNAVGSGETIILLKDSAGNGIKVPSGSNFIVDFNNYTYDIDGTTVGSSGTETNGFQLLRDSSIEFRNGKITSNKAKILIQNYCNLTLRDITLDGSNLVGNYTLSNNCGNTLIKDSTIIAKERCYAFDACWAPNKGYPEGAQVTVDNSKVVGNIEFGLWGTDKTPCLTTLTINSGEFIGDIIVTGIDEPNITINGGTFTNNPAEYLDQTKYGIVSENGTFTIADKWSTVGDTTWYGDGTSTEYTITTAEQLAGFANLVSEGKNFEGKIVKLGNNINLAGKLWVPIGMKVTEVGSSQPTATKNSFKGTFDGQEHEISNMRIDQWYATNGKGKTMYGLGLFHDMRGTLKNLTVKDAVVKATDGSPMQGNIFGIVAGYSYGTVTYENVHVINCNLAAGDICAFGKVGGILGMAAEKGGTTTFTNCSVENTTIAGVYNCASFAGLAQNSVVMTDCSTENVIWNKGLSEDNYLTINDFADDGVSFVSGTYWNYDGYYIYAAWAKYYNDYANWVDGGLDQDVTHNDTPYNYDGYCHNTIPATTN